MMRGMWLLTFLYVLLTAGLAWMLFGYGHVMWFVGLFRPQRKPRPPAEWPRVSVVVPCYNEEEGIVAKLDDLRALDYPRDRLEVVFAEGGSRDATLARLRGAMRPDELFRVVECPRPGKVPQLNHVLPSLQGAIVVNTDVDARMDPQALRWIAAEFDAAPEAWVVGAYCRPAEAIPVERYYWQAQNRGRLLESDAGALPIAIAQCYAFRRELLAGFPEDVVADDIYVALLAGTRGKHSVYSRLARAVETRGPSSVREFLYHKLRKSNAYLRETLRFAYRLPELGHMSKIMLLTRISQQLLLPWVMALWLLTAGALLTLFRVDLVVYGALFLAAMLLASRGVFQSVKLPEDEPTPLAVILSGYLLTNLILLATAISYPYLRQDSRYGRLPAATPASRGKPDRETGA